MTTALKSGTRIRDYGQLVTAYVTIVMLAIKRVRGKSEDISTMIGLLVLPIYYALNFKGEMETSVGHIIVSNRAVLRSFVYGLFKTRFAYVRNLQEIDRSSLSFGQVVDVGANTGDFTLATSKFAKHVVAIEPGGENFLALNANLQRNSISNVTPIQVAAHSRDEEVSLHGKNSNLYVGAGPNGQTVKGSALDSLFHDVRLKSIDIMKIDVQGHELSVIGGMSELLSDKRVNLLIIEVHLARGVSESEVTSLIANKGYRMIRRDGYLSKQPHLYFVPAFS